MCIRDSVKTVRSLIRQGRLRAVNFGTRMTRIYLQDLLAIAKGQGDQVVLPSSRSLEGATSKKAQLSLIHIYLADDAELAEYRDMFVFQCMVGCRHSDLVTFTPKNIIDGCLLYTSHQHRCQDRQHPMLVQPVGLCFL